MGIHLFNKIQAYRLIQRKFGWITIKNKML